MKYLSYLVLILVPFGDVHGTDPVFTDIIIEKPVEQHKINISQEEYARMMKIYLDNLKNESHIDSIPELLTFKSEGQSLYFPINEIHHDKLVDSAELRMLAPPIPDKDSLHISVYQILNPRKQRLISEKIIYPSSVEPKWIDLDLTAATASWMDGERNLGVEIDCNGCKGDFQHPLEAFVNALVVSKEEKERRRARRKIERTDCSSDISKKKKCCRHKMHVDFTKMKFGEMDTILQPKSYEAGYCRGRCPINHNYATNHSRIQTLVHGKDKTVPRACCAQSKLTYLEIIQVDPHDPSKLHMGKWDSMIVLECACS